MSKTNKEISHPFIKAQTPSVGKIIITQNSLWPPHCPMAKSCSPNHVSTFHWSSLNLGQKLSMCLNKGNDNCSTSSISKDILMKRKERKGPHVFYISIYTYLIYHLIYLSLILNHIRIFKDHLILIYFILWHLIYIKLLEWIITFNKAVI